MKKLICLIVAILLIISCVSGCSGAESEAQASFEKMMDAFKTCDKTQIDKYYSFDKLMVYIEETDGELLRDAILSTLSKMDYKVNSAEKTSSNAVKLSCEVTTVDFSGIINNYIDKVTALVASDEYLKMVPRMEESEYQALMIAQMIAAIEESGEATTTKAVDVIMTKNGTEWTLGGNADELLGVLFENLSDAVEYLA